VQRCNEPIPAHAACWSGRVLFIFQYRSKLSAVLRDKGGDVPEMSIEDVAVCYNSNILMSFIYIAAVTVL
jgi:hypothetical protein